MGHRKATARHEQLRLSVIEAMRSYDDIPAEEQLAVLSAFLGQLMALQDSRKFTGPQLMEMVARNIEWGNANAITAVAMGVIKP